MRPCLHHQLGECLAPCASLTTPEEYGAVVREVIDFLGGKSGKVIDRLTAQMNQAAKEMRFEQAAMLRDRIRDAQNLMERQKAIHVNGGDQDILACTGDGIDAMVEVVYVRGGHMIGARRITRWRARATRAARRCWAVHHAVLRRRQTAALPEIPLHGFAGTGGGCRTGAFGKKGQQGRAD